MNPAGAGGAEFGGECIGRVEASVAGRAPSPSREAWLTVSDAHSLIGSAQRLVDKPPGGRYTVAWCMQAASIGDVGALGAVATIAARSTAAVD